jgi:hypothetical protein
MPIDDPGVNAVSSLPRRRRFSAFAAMNRMSRSTIPWQIRHVQLTPTSTASNRFWLTGGFVLSKKPSNTNRLCDGTFGTEQVFDPPNWQTTLLVHHRCNPRVCFRGGLRHRNLWRMMYKSVQCPGPDGGQARTSVSALDVVSPDKASALPAPGQLSRPMLFQIGFQPPGAKPFTRIGRIGQKKYCRLLICRHSPHLRDASNICGVTGSLARLQHPSVSCSMKPRMVLNSCAPRQATHQVQP